MNKKLILVLLLFQALFSCKTESIDNPEPLEAFDVSIIKFESIRSFPAGRVDLKFSVDTMKLDTNLFSIAWENPISNKPFESQVYRISDDITLQLSIENKASKKVKHISCHLLFDTLYNNPKYDYRLTYLGYYHMLVITNSWGYNKPEIFDTSNCLGTVSLFKGYTAENGSNYHNIDYKIGITYSTYDTIRDDSRCSGINYYTDGFIHPSVDLYGKLTYEELDNCDGASNGYLKNDSLIFDYHYSNNWDGFTRKIIGVKLK